MALDDVTVVIPTIVALANYALVAFHLLAESVLAAREDDTHCVGEKIVTIECRCGISWNFFGQVVIAAESEWLEGGIDCLIVEQVMW